MKKQNSKIIEEKKKIKEKGFTLVELIVTITILAILATIAFISFTGYSQSSRDGARIADLTMIKKSLELFSIKSGNYPQPTNGIDITYSGSIVWNQGSFGNTTFRNVERLNKIPLDPLLNIEYTYSVTKKGNEYELAGIFEKSGLAKVNLLNKVYAASDKNASAMVMGNYNGQMLQNLSGSNCDILALPSIITSDITKTRIEDIISSGSLVYNNFNNLPHTFANTQFKIDGGFDYKPSIQKLVAYRDTSSCSDLTADSSKGIIERRKLLQGLQNSYSGTILMSNLNNLLKLNSSQGEQYMLLLLNKNFNGSTKSMSTTSTFTLESSNISDTDTTTISDNCTNPPTGYTSSNTSVATISGNTITAVGAGTTNIEPIGGDCADSDAKVLTVIHVIPTYPFDNLNAGTTFKYDNNSSWANAVFQSYGTHDGHKTVKLYIPNGIAGFGVPLMENMSITEFYYTVYSSSNAGSHYLAVNQIPSDGDARVYNSYNYHPEAFIEHANLGQWKSTAFYEDKVLNNNYIYISAGGGEPYYVEFYVSTGGFKFDLDTIPFYSTTTITDSCLVSPTSYTSSDTSVATISGNTIIGVASGTTIITPTSGNCSDMRGKVFTVVGNPPTDTSYPFDALVSGRDEPYFKYDHNTSWANTVFQSYGTHDGHKTVKLYIPNGVAGIGIPLMGNVSITKFHYTVYQASVAGSHYLAVNQIPSDGDARVYNSYNYHPDAYIEHANLGQWKTTSFYVDKVLNNNYIYISSAGNEPYRVEFYVSTL